MNQVTSVASVGFVVIGRNEGERLKRCLESVMGAGGRVVYVDSGSTDGSVTFAAGCGATVVELGLNQPFTAARARNAGYAQLKQVDSTVEYVMFLDGDCRLVPGFVDQALSLLNGDDRVAAVCGRRREIEPEATIYNRMADMEWNTPVGQADACGGDAVFRTKAFDAVDGFNPSLIAGEEPELCVRLRQAGWTIHRIDAEMALHDAAMTRFGQWWKRNVRAGYAFAQGAAMHGRSPQRHWVRPVRSNWFWGLIYPLLIVATAWPTGGWSLLGLAAYPLMAARIARGRRRAFGDPWRHALLYGVFTMIGKFPTMLGQVRYHLNRSRGRQGTIIEYKSAVNH